MVVAAAAARTPSKQTYLLLAALRLRSPSGPEELEEIPEGTRTYAIRIQVALLLLAVPFRWEQKGGAVVRQVALLDPEVLQVPRWVRQQMEADLEALQLVSEDLVVVVQRAGAGQGMLVQVLVLQVALLVGREIMAPVAPPEVPGLPVATELSGLVVMALVAVAVAVLLVVQAGQEDRSEPVVAVAVRRVVVAVRATAVLLLLPTHQRQPASRRKFFSSEDLLLLKVAMST